MPERLAERDKVVIGYHYNPRRKVFLISIGLKNDPSSLASVASLLSSAGVNTLSGFTAVEGNGGKGFWGFFAEADKDLRASQIKKAIDSSPYVLYSVVEEGTAGLVVDTAHFPLKLNSGETMILARREVFGDMFRRLGEMFGTGGEAIVFEEGEATGESDARRLIDVFGRETAQATLPELSMLYLTLGWGRPELVRFSPAPFGATVRLFNNFECSGQKATKQNSNFIRGHMTGLVNVLFGKDVHCRETKCLALGDEYCEFELVERSWDAAIRASRASSILGTDE